MQIDGEKKTLFRNETILHSPVFTSRNTSGTSPVKREDSKVQKKTSINIIANIDPVGMAPS
jgi:hypothetical protein